MAGCPHRLLDSRPQRLIACRCSSRARWGPHRPRPRPSNGASPGQAAAGRSRLRAKSLLGMGSPSLQHPSDHASRRCEARQMTCLLASEQASKPAQSSWPPRPARATCILHLASCTWCHDAGSPPRRTGWPLPRVGLAELRNPRRRAADGGRRRGCNGGCLVPIGQGSAVLAAA